MNDNHMYMDDNEELNDAQIDPRIWDDSEEDD